MSTIKNMHNNNFKKLILADFISSLGSNMTSIAIMLIVYQKTQDIFITSLFVLVNLIPQLILTPFINKINLKWSFRSIFAIGEFICALLLGSLLINDSLISIFLLFSLFGIVFFVLEGYRAEYLKVISTNETIYKYQSISRTANIIVTLLGPLIAGWIMVSYGSNVIYGIDIVTYVIAGVIILTLSYIMEILHSTTMHYTILMSCMALGSIIGNMVINLPLIKSRLKFFSIISTLMMGFLLMLVVFKPGFIAMLMILTVSGFLSALVMIYYATEIYMRYTGDEIRVKYAYFQNSINLSTAVSKPVGGILSKEIGVITSLFFCGYFI